MLTCEVDIADQKRQYFWDHGSMTANGKLERHSKFWSNYGFVSAFSMHPAWGGLTEPLPEICVHNIGHVTVRKVESLIDDRKLECKGCHKVDSFGGCGNEACRGKRFCVVACPHCPDAKNAVDIL